MGYTQRLHVGQAEYYIGGDREVTQVLNYTRERPLYVTWMSPLWRSIAGNQFLDAPSSQGTIDSNEIDSDKDDVEQMMAFAGFVGHPLIENDLHWSSIPRVGKILSDKEGVEMKFVSVFRVLGEKYVHIPFSS